MKVTKLVPMLLVAPLIMGATGCPPIPNAQWINANVYVGVLDAPPPESEEPGGSLVGGPDSVCPDDPWGLQNYQLLRTNLDWIVGQGAVPTVAAGDPDGIATAALPDGHGWYGTLAYIPTKILLRRIAFGGQLFRGYWFVGTKEVGACAAGATGRCNFIRIAAQLVAPGFYDITSGWYIPATGVLCVTRWTSVPARCHYPNSGSSMWETCWMPTADVARPNFTGTEE